MTKKVYTAAAQAKSQIDTLTLAGTLVAGETATVTIGSASVVYTIVTGDTLTTAALAIVALCDGATDAQFRDASYTSALGVITVTSTEGVPITISTSETLTGTFVTANVQAATGPNHWDNAANWSTGVVPVTGGVDEISIENSRHRVLYGLPNSTMVLVSFWIKSGQIGLPSTNAGGYYEYRQQRAKFTATTCNIGLDGSGPSICRIDLESTATTITVYGSGRNGNGDAVDILNVNSSTVLSVIDGQVAIALLGTEVSTFNNSRIGPRGELSIGDTVSIAGYIVSAGKLNLASNITTLTIEDGVTTTEKTCAVSGAIYMHGGSLVVNSSGTIALLDIENGSVDFSKDSRPKTVTSCVLRKNATINDPYQVSIYSFTVTFGGNTDGVSTR